MELLQANSEPAETVIIHPVSAPVERRKVNAGHFVSTWDEADIKTATDMWTSGHSGTLIALKLNRTRNSVIGKLSRLGLLDNTGTRKTTVSYGGGKARIARPLPKFKRLEHAKLATVEPTGHNCDIEHLTDTTCHWPHDGPDGFFYCGSPEADMISGIPYCPYHCKIAYRVAA